MPLGNQDNLKRAAQAKRTAAIQRAEVGLRRLIKQGDLITFENLARAGGISKGFLYDNNDLRARIVALRQKQGPHQREEIDDVRQQDDTSSVVRTLAAKLSRERAAHREETRRLNDALEVAHSELLRLRRVISSPGEFRATETRLPSKP